MASRPLKVAIVGAGPAGLYVADALTFQDRYPVEVDVLDRLPTPFGLLRYGVAPDHLKMKSLARTLQRTLDNPSVRFLGGVSVGSDISVSELRARYHAVVYAFGAATDRKLQVPGEDLAGSRSATQFVNWYSGHPDVSGEAFELDSPAAGVVGLGNVAVDVARMLLKDPSELAKTDIPMAVLHRLQTSKVRDVHILGRRGPEHANWTTKELRELTSLEGVDVLVSSDEVARAVYHEQDPHQARNLEVLAEVASRPVRGEPKRLHVHFWSRPSQLLGEGSLQSVLVERTRADETGSIVARGDSYELRIGLLLRSVGYRGSPITGVPFDEDRGVIPSLEGRVIRSGCISPGEYVVGWIGRGPVGVLGTNRSDAEDLVALMDRDADSLRQSRTVDEPPLRECLIDRDVSVVDGAGWARIDAAEIAAGTATGRPRAKLSSYAALYAAAVGPS